MEVNSTATESGGTAGSNVVDPLLIGRGKLEDIDDPQRPIATGHWDEGLKLGMHGYRRCEVTAS